jgi:hypothetical protein
MASSAFSGDEGPKLHSLIVTANFKFGGKVILPELLFSRTEFRFRPHPGQAVLAAFF